MTTLTRSDWEQRAQQLKIEGRAFINGEYTDAVSKETFDFQLLGTLFPVTTRQGGHSSVLLLIEIPTTARV